MMMRTCSENVGDEMGGKKKSVFEHLDFPKRTFSLLSCRSRSCGKEIIEEEKMESSHMGVFQIKQTLYHIQGKAGRTRLVTKNLR